MDKNKTKNYLLTLLVLYAIITIWSLIKPFDWLLWILESGPAITGTLVLYATYSKFHFSKTSYTWWFIAACMMTIGAHYSFSQVPIFNWLKEVFDWNRNNYDKVGHIVQGIVPVLLVRELLIKRLKLNNVFWINFIALFVSLGISALYEISEWLSTFIATRTENDFLGEE